jgi:peptidyl-prolyl cis-trans isomerase SurA
VPDPAAKRPAADRPRLLAALGLALLAAPAAAEEILVDGIAAQVGSEIVLISEVRQISSPIEARMRAGGAPDEEIAKLRADVLEGLVDRALVRQVVRRTEIDASEAEVDDAIAAIAKENGLTAEQLQASVESQGLSFQAYRAKIRGEIEHTKVMNGMVASQVRIEDDEVMAAYREEFSDQPRGGEEVHLRHLLVPFTSAKPEEQRAACREARQARARIEGGEPFAEVAAQVSPINPQQGGDIGWIHVASLASWMAPAVDSLATGQTSDVIEMPFGCNLLQLLERRSYEPVTFAQAEDLLRQKLFEEKMREQYIVFIEKLRTQTYVERKGYFADAARLGDDLPPPDPAAAGLGGQ